MVVSLLIGLPGDRPGGLLLTVFFFLTSGLAALVVGFAYAIVGVLLPRASLPLQGTSAVLRGVPLLLLVFMLAHVPWLTMRQAGFIALTIYSFSHVGEVLRSFLAAYPRHLADQSRVIDIRPWSDWLELRTPWTLWRAWNALFTHWVSLLKDTGSLVVLGIGELTMVAKVLSELEAGFDGWLFVLVLAAALYLIATLLLIRMLQVIPGRLGKLTLAERVQG